MARENRSLVQRTHGHIERRGHDGVSQNSARSGNVWRELFRDQEQKRHRLVAGR